MTNIISYYVYEHRRKDSGEVFYIGKGTHTLLSKYNRSRTSVKRNQFWNNIVKKSGGFDGYVIAEFFTEDAAFDFEKEKINEYGRKIDGGMLCNMTLGGDGHLGRKLSDETKRKMSVARKGQKRTPEQCKAISERLTGVIRTKEHCKNISIAKTGRKATEATKAIMSEQRAGKDHPRYGKEVTETQRIKQSASMKGKLSGDKNPNYGKAMSNNQKEKLSKAMKGREALHNRRPIYDGSTGITYAHMQAAAEGIGLHRDTIRRRIQGIFSNPTNLRYA